MSAIAAGKAKKREMMFNHQNKDGYYLYASYNAGLTITEIKLLYYVALIARLVII